MEDLRFYDFNFNLLHIEHDFSSVYWRLLYNGIGSFEGVFSAKSTLCDLVTDYEYLIVCQGEKQAIITTKKIEKGRLYLMGRTVNFLLSKRVILPFSTYKTDVEKDGVSLSLYVIDTCFNDFVTKGTTISCARNEHFWRNTAHPAIEVIVDCLNKENAGHNLTFDPEKKQWIFNIYKGKELPLVISEANLNVFDTEYTFNLLDYATKGYFHKSLSYKGLWNPVTNSPSLTDLLPENYGKSYCVSESGTWNGIDFKKDDYIICKTENGKFEKSEEIDGFWVKIGDETTGVLAWECVLDSANPDSAREELNLKKLKESAQGKIKNSVYGKDFNLGDIITFSNEAGGKTKTFRQRINAVSIWYESGKTMGVKPEFKEV